MADDPNIPPSAAPVVAAAAVASAPGKITCSYCECVLAADGGVLRTSDRVKQLNRLDERIENLKTENARLESELVAVRAELATVKASLAAATAGPNRDPWT